MSHLNPCQDGQFPSAAFHFERIFAHFSEPLAATDADRRILWCNRAFEELTGYTLDELRGMDKERLYSASIHPDRPLPPIAPHASCPPGDHNGFAKTYKHKNGAMIATESIMWPVFSDEGEPICHATISRDVTERNRLDNARRSYVSLLTDQRLAEGDKIDAILSLACDVFKMPVALVGSVDGDVMSVVHSRSTLLNIPRGTRFDIAHNKCSQSLAQDRPVPLNDPIEIGENATFLEHGLRAYFGIRLSVGAKCFGTFSLCSPLMRAPFTPDESDLISLFASGIEQLLATEMRLSKLESAATRDWLTGALTGRQFRTDLQETFARVRRNSATASLILFDVDHFKSINDNFGHDMGDRALVEIVQRAERVLGPNRKLYRIGGEEFAVILAGSRADSAALMAERLREKIAVRTIEGNGLPRVTASFGVAELDDDLTNEEAWLKCADIALYGSKNSGRNRVTDNRKLSGMKRRDSLPPSTRRKYSGNRKCSSSV